MLSYANQLLPVAVHQLDRHERVTLVELFTHLTGAEFKKYLPGTPRADVKCNFGLWFRLIRAAPLAELTAGWSQACDTLHPQVIQVLCGGRRGQRDTRKDGGRRRKSRKGRRKDSH